LSTLNRQSNSAKRCPVNIDLAPDADADADIGAVVEGLRTFGYYNAGQDCTAACRIYAGAKVYDKLVADLSSAVKSIKMGTQDEPDVEIGPPISAPQDLDLSAI
jgi:acyl-CoA reductase-like NAD-dependent aldehyde dehydrogenase